jgi:hypothetical protein
VLALGNRTELCVPSINVSPWPNVSSERPSSQGVLFRLAVFHLTGAEHVEVERTPILADLVLYEGMKLRKHALDQRRVAAGMIGMGQIGKLGGIVHEPVKLDIAGCEEVVECASGRESRAD